MRVGRRDLCLTSDGRRSDFWVVDGTFFVYMLVLGYVYI